MVSAMISKSFPGSVIFPATTTVSSPNTPFIVKSAAKAASRDSTVRVSSPSPRLMVSELDGFAKITDSKLPLFASIVIIPSAPPESLSVATSLRMLRSIVRSATTAVEDKVIGSIPE